MNGHICHQVNTATTTAATCMTAYIPGIQRTPTTSKYLLYLVRQNIILYTPGISSTDDGLEWLILNFAIAA